MSLLSGDVVPRGQLGEGGDDGGPPQLKYLVLLKVPPKKWYTLGLQLGITEYDLDVIKDNNPNDVETCILEMFKKWLHSTSNPSYAGLLEALYRIEEKMLAAHVLSHLSGIYTAVIDDCSNECPELCGQKALRGKLKACNVKEDCSKSPNCSVTSTYEDITKNHLPQCEEEVVPCPNNYGDVTIKHKDLKEHIDQCPHTTVICKYSFVGCKHRSTRQLINMHMESHKEKHQIMALKFIHENESTIKSLSEKCKLLKEKFSLAIQTYSIPEITTDNILDSEAWSSEPFYTHLGGYKMLLTISGYHPEKTHLEIGVRVMIGEFDEELKVPFIGTITLQLVDHSELLDHRGMKYRLNQHESYSQIPFISYEELTSQEYRFLIANEITIRVVGIEVKHDPHVQPTVVPQEESLEQCKKKHQQLKILKQQISLLNRIGSTSELRWCIYAKYPEFVMDKFLQYFQNGKLWYSEGFYTHFGRYKLCLEVNAAGTGRWAGNYISVGLHLMKGDFDNALQFPFYGEITVQLVDKDNHITKVFIFDDKTKKAGARADQNMNKESCDVPDFVSVKYIKENLMDNSIALRVVNIAIKEEEDLPTDIRAIEGSMTVQAPQDTHAIEGSMTVQVPQDTHAIEGSMTVQVPQDTISAIEESMTIQDQRDTRDWMTKLMDWIQLR